MLQETLPKGRGQNDVALHQSGEDYGVDPDTAERDACSIEHVITEELFRRLKAVAEPES